MTGSNSMSSGYGSMDEDNDDLAFFTAKSSFFQQLQAKKEPKGTDGIIEVHLKLRRANAVQTKAGPAGGGAEPPTDVVKRLHVSSSTTVNEVIQGLLEKFMVPDNPRRFSLYCQKQRDGQDVLQKLSPSERPLCLQEEAGPDTKPITFILRENESTEVEWQAFSIPELQNFLMMLGKEEEERVRQVELRYKRYREKLRQVLQEAQGKPG
ncbi:hypothetical protein MATL_G00110680 [Megalops atlanticus]|uniref:Ras association domain-containing protein 5 n=1 Tax=Megalops atlanticus TaxID=7932 RepID=A0A9D3T5Y0_MEGAT|nr:hypothetical protein MATL_G00110680 [Megalops atlanticus]